MSSLGRRPLLLAAAAVFAISVCMAQTMDRQRFEALVAEGANLSEQDFSGAPLSGLDARGLDLRNSMWVGADLRGSRFVACDLEGADLSRASARGVIIQDSVLAETRMVGTDLSGALLVGVNLAGADMTDCRLDGALFDQVRLSSNGGTHPPALTLALRRATGTDLSRQWVSGISGDAFSFVYNTEQPSHWPCRPYHQNPALAAGRAIGVEMEVYYDLPPPEAYARLKQSVQDGLVCIIPVRLVRPQILDAEQQGVWVLVESIEPTEAGDIIALTMPPLGAQRWNEAQLKMNWSGPWPTLHPAGHPRSSGQYPLVTIAPTRAAVTAPEQISVALQLAADISADPRSYGPLVPGVRGLARLAEDLALAGTQQEPQRMAQLGMWGGHPRRCLAGARTEAHRFCAAAAEISQEPNRSTLTQMAALYESQVRMLEEMFPDLAAQDRPDPAELGGRFLAAADVIQQLRETDLRIAALIAQLQ